MADTIPQSDRTGRLASKKKKNESVIEMDGEDTEHRNRPVSNSETPDRPLPTPLQAQAPSFAGKKRDRGGEYRDDGSGNGAVRTTSTTTTRLGRVVLRLGVTMSRSR